MSITYTILNTDGTETALRNPELRDLQAAVGGWLEAITLRPSETLLVNEDGLSLGLPLNHAATVMFGSPIVGPAVLVVGDETLDGDSTCDRCGENDIQEDGRCSTCDRDPETLD